MKKTQQKVNYTLVSVVAVAVVAIVGFAGYITAQTLGTYGSVNVENANINFNAPEGAAEGVLGGTTQSDWNVGGNLTVDGISTIQDISLGSKYSSALTFTAGATTTPGGLFAIENTGSSKICTRVELDITTGSTVGGRLGTGHPIVFSISTSTAEGVGNGANLIATSTLATSTTNLLDTVVNKGSGVAVAAQSFEWATGEVIQGQFDGLSTDPATSSIPYVGMAGKAYITCHDK